jgi:glyoxylase-like metal-dependent hydrolase (beta-lactamase superfamily II)
MTRSGVRTGHMRIKRRVWIPALVLAALLIGKYFLLDTASEAKGAYVIDVEALHRAATAGGALPERIEVEKVGDFAFPRNLVVAGEGFHLHSMVLLSHRVVWPDRTLVIDAAMSPEAAKKMPGSKMDVAAWERVQAAIRKANLIVFTHEHADHINGIASTPDFAAIAGNVRITREQLEGPKLERDAFPAGALGSLHPLEYDGVYALAPGVALQKAPGHTPGSQLVYVELANGTRFLFVGDIAWTHENIAEQVGRPRLAQIMLGEDREAVAAEVKALGALPRDVHVIVAHDPIALDQDLRAGLYRQGFGNL